MLLQQAKDDVIYYSQECRDNDIVGDEFYPIATKEFGYRILRGSAAGISTNEQTVQERIFRSFLNGDIKNAVEIGTWRGLSAAILAHYADKVVTVDIRYYDEAPRLWMWAGVLRKILYLVVKDNESKKKALEDIDFDFAFIDGMHTYKDVKYDFECVKKCGRVLFHDYTEECPGVMEFIDELPKEEVTIKKPFALWKSND